MKRLLFIAALLLAASVREGSGQFVDQAVIWFPSGVAVVGLLLLGAREAWTVALFTFVHRLLIGYDAGVAVSAAAGSTAEAFVGYLLLRKLGFDASFARLRDFLALLAAAAAAPLASILGSWLGRALVWANPDMPFNSGWGGWWRMNALGVLTVVPPVVTWLSESVERFPARRVVAAAAGAAATAVAVVVLLVIVPVSVTGVLLLTAILPASLWAGVRFGPRGAASAGALVAVVVALATAHGAGPFLSISRDERHTALQLFELVIVTVPLVLGVLVAERESALVLGARSEELRSSIQLALPDVTYRIRRDLICADVIVPDGSRSSTVRDRLVGRSLGEVLPPETAGLLERSVAAVLSDRGALTVDYPLTVDGRRRIHEARCVPYGDDEILAVVRDVTDRTMAERTTAFEARALGLVATGRPVAEVLEAIALGMETLTDGLCSILLLRDGRLHVAAAPSLPAALREAVEGLPAEPGASPWGAAASDGAKRVAEDVETDPLWRVHRDLALRLGLRAHWTLPIREPGGTVLGAVDLVFRERRTPHGADLELAEGAATLAGIALERERSTEALRRSEETYRVLNEELEVRVLARTAELTEANRELEAFSYSVSHELRAPLRAIDGHLALLGRDHAERQGEEALRHFERVRWNAQRMGRLIDDLLAFSRAGRVELTRRPVDMADAARAAFVEAAQGAGDLSRIGFVLGELPEIPGDAHLLRLAWGSLLANAVKFSGGRERPEIRVDGFLAGGEAIYRVGDNGVGFDMAYVGKLFGVFHRLHAIHEFEGTGVGLALVRRIVLRHGGRVWAEGEPDAGATFSFSIPAPEGAGS